MLTANNFSHGLLTPVLGYLMSCLGVFLGLHCATRALASPAASRARWLALAALAFGTTGIWVMHFIAMLGYSIPGESIRYNVPITLLSMAIAVVAVGAGLFLVGFGRGRFGSFLVGGLVMGIGVASVHYVDMAGMRMPASMTDKPLLLVVIVLIAVAGSTALLWVVPRLHRAWPTLGVALVAGAVVSGLHYTGMAGMNIAAPAMGAMSGGMSMGGGATALSFLMPLIVGISSVAFILTAILALSPTPEEIRSEAQLMERIGRHRMQKPGRQPAFVDRGPQPRSAAHASSNGNGRSRRASDKTGAPGRTSAPAPGSLFVKSRPAAPGTPVRAPGHRGPSASGLSHGIPAR